MLHKSTSQSIINSKHIYTAPRVYCFVNYAICDYALNLKNVCLDSSQEKKTKDAGGEIFLIIYFYTITCHVVLLNNS